jgi:hypothetical protein
VAEVVVPVLLPVAEDRRLRGLRPVRLRRGHHRVHRRRRDRHSPEGEAE